MSFIEVRHLRKEFDDTVPLKDVSVDIEKGEVISIIGPSGSGKSTFLRCINRLETPTSGDIFIDGVNVCDPATDLTKVRRRMGMVFQSFNLFPHLMAVENIMRPLQSLLGYSPKEAYDEAMEQLMRVGLDSRARRYPDELSGGQKQRVEIARALAMHPDIMLFDEPTSALDPAKVSEVLSVIQDLAGTGLTMLTVTHEMRLAREVSNRVFFMDEGGIYEDGPPEQIFENPVGRNTRIFVYRIRSWEYAFTYGTRDLPEMMGSLKEFCRRQFMKRGEATRAQLAIEEMVTSHLIPAMEKEPDVEVRFVLNARETGSKMNLVVDCRQFSEGVAVLDGERDPISDAILNKLLRRIDPPYEGLAMYEIGK